VVLGQNVRPAGGDLRRGDSVVRKGHVIGPTEIGLLAAAGTGRLRAHPRPTVAIIPTGDELVELTDRVKPGQVRNSNAWALEALARRYGAEPRRLPIARDTVEGIHGALGEAQGAHLIVSTGGVSMGDRDVVKNVLATEGELDFWQVNMRPGKPLAFGRVNGTPFVGLPGNPVSSLVGFELFVRPALLKLMGQRNLEKPQVQAVAEERLVSSEGKRMFLRVIVRREGDRLVCAQAGDQRSFRLTSMTQGNGLAVVPEGAAIEPGEPVTVLALDERAWLAL
jgi:molybdopterin molybdotransferase